MKRHMWIPGIIVLFSCLSFLQVQAQVNLLNNSSFETQGTTSQKSYYWEYGNPNTHGSTWGTAARQGWRSISGSWEAAICGSWFDGDDTDGGYWQEVAATPGKRYRFAGWFFADGDGTGNKWLATTQGMKLEFYTSSESQISVLDQPILDAGPNWVYKNIEAIAPANAAWVRVVVYATGVGANGALQFDDLVLTEVEADTTVSPGASSRRTGLVFSEIMYHPADETCEFVELYNTTPFTNSLDGYRLSGDIDYEFTSETVIPPFSYLVVAENPSAIESAYGISGVLGPYAGDLSNGSGKIRLRKVSDIEDQGDAILLEVNYSDKNPWPVAADGGGHSLVLSEASYGEDDSRAWASSANVGGSPSAAEPITESVYDAIVINEFMAHTDQPAWDFIELYNSSASSVNISACTLNDTLSTNNAFVIPEGTIIPAGGYQVYFAITNPPSSSPTNLTFNLSSKGEDVVFRSPDGRIVDVIRFAAQQNGVSVGRYPDGASDLNELLSSTPGQANTALLIRDVVINEIMYNPISCDDDDQYIELHNTGSSSADISNWRFVSGIDYTFPSGTTIPAGGYLVVAKKAEHLMTNYPGILNAGNTVGDFSGNLANSGERIALAKPDNPALPHMDFVIVDEVTYRDGGQWGNWSDGDGSSLELMDPHSDNNRASNWADSDESDKGEWTLIEHTGVLDNGMLPSGVSIDELHVVMQGRGQIQLDNVEARRVVSDVEQGNRIGNSTFESGTGGWTIEGNVVQSGLANEGYSSSHSLQLRATGMGDTGANRVKTGLSSYFYSGQTAVLRARARWVCGGSHLILRLRGNYLEAEAQVPVPKNLGTPARQNSRYVANAGPAIWDVRHDPLLPEANEDVVVSARVRDPDGLSSVQLRYRIDPSSTTTTVSMTHAGNGVYTASIPGQAFGKIAAFRVFATDTSAAGSRFPKAGVAGARPGPGRECLVRFGDVSVASRLDSLIFWLTEDNMSEWTERERHSNEYLDTTVICDGQRAVYDAAIRFRGSPWVRPHLADPENFEWRSSYRVEVPGDQAYLGVTEMNLDTMENIKDPTFQRERTCYKIAEQLGLTASYQRYVFICMNGLQFPYAYADIHHVEGDYLETWYPDDSDGELFKLDDWVEYKSFAVLDFCSVGASLDTFTTTGGELKKARYRWNWEKKANGDYNDNYSHFLALVEAANNSDDLYVGNLESVADVKQWMRIIAFRHIIADWDAFGYRRGKNAFLYRPDAGRFQLLPWDLDYGLTALGESDNWDHDLFDVDTMDVTERMVDKPAFRRYYWQALNDAAHGPLLSTRINPMMDEVHTALFNEKVAAEDASAPKSWVANRRSYILNQLYSVTSTAFSIYNASSITVSSNQALLYGTAPIQDVIIKVNGKPVTPRWVSVSSWYIDVVVTNGINTVTVQGCDEDGNQISDHSEQVQITYSGTEDSIEDSIVINEIMYNPLENGTGFIELYNRSDSTSFDLYNCRLNGVDLTFTESTLIEPGQHLIVVSDALAFVAKYGTDIPIAAQWDGSLDNSGEWIKLYQLNELKQPVLLIDAVRYNDVAPWPTEADGAGCSLQLIDADEDNNRVGNWAADTGNPATPGAENSVVRDLPAFPEVRINEVQSFNSSTMADNAGDYDPWFELYNGDSSSFSASGYYMTDDYNNLFKWALPDITIAASGFQMIWADNESGVAPEYHANFILNTNGGNLALVRNCSGTPVIIDYNNYDEINEDIAYGCYPDGAWTNRQLFYYPTPGSANDNSAAPAEIYINEWMADNDNGIVDPATVSPEDWFELYNAEEYAVDITGYTLSDDPGDPEMWTVSGTVVLQPKEYRLVWADDESSYNTWGTNALHANFKLGKSGETVTLYAPNGEVVDSVTFGEQTSDISEGRYPDGSSSCTNLGVATPWAANILDPSLRSITVTCNGNGSMSPSGNQSVSVGSSLGVSITADQYFVISDILTNGASTGASYGMTETTYTWHNVNESGSIYIEFTPVETTNGTPHYWMAEYGLTGDWDAASSEDQDGDGLTTWQEYIAGTSPVDSNSLFYTDANAPDTQDGFILTWNSISNRYYTVYRTADLNEEGIVVYNRMHATPPQNTYTDVTATVDSKYYYWIKVED